MIRAKIRIAILYKTGLVEQVIIQMFDNIKEEQNEQDNPVLVV